MGYSERYCHICGVSFNIGRIRTKDEPRSHAWRDSRKHGALSFVDGGRNSHIGECERDAGCMLAYREDMAKEVERRRREHSRLNGGQTPHEEVGIGDSGNDKDGGDDGDDDDHEDDKDDEDFVPDPNTMELLRNDEETTSTNNASMLQKVISLAQSTLTRTGNKTVDDISTDPVGSGDHGILDKDQAIILMDYEYDSPSETCSEYESDKEEDHMISTSDDEDEADARYRDFVQSLKPEDRAKSSRDEKELILPLFRPMNGRDGDTASTHGSDASFECDEAEDNSNWHNKKLDHWICGKLSHYDHPLSKGSPHHDRDSCWEHIAGPGCLNSNGYHGTRISKEEMHFANTLQCLVRKADASINDGEKEASSALNWQSRWDDEPWEQGASWFLSGICDYMPSRDCDDPEVFPVRHGRQSINAENVCWDSDVDDLERQYAMPFHPSCLEIYKRASTRRHGSVNIDVLGSWWQLKSRYDEFHDFPRSEAVKRGEEQWWRHNPGDEHLAADPLWPPGLVGAIQSAKLEKPWTRTGKSKPSRWASLPLEIITQVLNYLDTVSIATTSLAISETGSVAKPLIQRRLQVQYPHLWELSSTQPYYKWVGLTAQELETRQQKLDQEEAQFLSVCKILEQEGCDNARDRLKQYWEEGSELRTRKVFECVMSGKSPLQIPTDEIGIAKFVIALHEAETSDNLKGLQNRDRIWKDCETILDQIEELQKEGEILPNGQPRPGAQLSEN